MDCNQFCENFSKVLLFNLELTDCRFLPLMGLLLDDNYYARMLYRHIVRTSCSMFIVEANLSGS